MKTFISGILLLLGLGVEAIAATSQTVPQFSITSSNNTVLLVTNAAGLILDLTAVVPASTNSGNLIAIGTNSAQLNGTGGYLSAPELIATNKLVVAGITNTLQIQLIAWTASGSYQITTNSYDGTYNTMQTGYVVWPDGNYGAWTNTNTNTTFGTVDGYVVTHVASGKTVTQGTMLRNSNGQVTNTPALVVTP